MYKCINFPRSHTIDYLDMGSLLVACEAFIVPCHE